MAWASGSLGLFVLRPATIGLAFRLRGQYDIDIRGFDTTTATKGSGLTNMTDRVKALGGEVEMTSAPGRGTQLHGSSPVEAVGVSA